MFSLTHDSSLENIYESTEDTEIASIGINDNLDILIRETEKSFSDSEAVLAGEDVSPRPGTSTLVYLRI